MLTVLSRLLLICLLVLGISSARAQERVTPEEAQAKIAIAVAALKSEGPAAYAKFSDRNGGFVDRDFYVVVFDRHGKCLAHGFNAALIGQDMWEIQDPDGVKFVQEFWKVVETHPDDGMVRFRFTNPVTKKIEAKAMLVRKVGDVVLVAGYYPKA